MVFWMIICVVGMWRR